MEELNQTGIKKAERELLLDFEAGMAKSLSNRGRTVWQVWNQSRQETFKSTMSSIHERVKTQQGDDLMSSFGLVKNLVLKWGRTGPDCREDDQQW